MPVPLADDPEEELTLLDYADAQWQRARRRVSGWDDDTAAMVGQWAGAAPWVEPDAVLSLSESRVNPYSPPGREIAAAAGEDYFQGFRQGAEPGEGRLGSNWWGRARQKAGANMSPEAMAATDPRVQAALAPSAIERVMAGEMTAAELLAADPNATWGMYTDVHNATIELRNLLADQFGQEWVDEKRGITRAERPDGISDEDWAAIQTYLNGGPDPQGLSPEADRYLTFEATVDRDPIAPSPWSTAIESGTVDPSVLTAEALDEHLSTVERPDGGNVISDTLTPIIRTAGMALNAPIQEVQGGFRSLVSNVRENGWAGALTQTPGEAIADTAVEGHGVFQSDLGIAAEQLLNGRRVDTGEGYFVNPTSGVGVERLRREQSYGSVDGQVITPGRWFADTFTGLDHGDRGYGALSGTIDFAATVYGDPLNVAASAISDAYKARTLFSGAGTLGDEVVPIVSRLDRARTAAAEGLESIGALPRAPIPDLDPTTVSGWLLAGDGRQIAQAMADEPSVLNLWQGTKGKLRPESYAAIADASTVDDVIPVLFDELRLHGDRSFRYAQPTADMTRGSWWRRSLAMAPASEIRLDRSDEFMHGIYDVLANALVPRETIEARMRDAALATERGGRVAVFEAALDDVARSLIDSGLDEPSARALTRHVVGDATQDRVFAAFNGAISTDLPDFKIPDGNGGFRPEPRAHLYSEFAPDSVKIPNAREIKRLTTSLGRLKPLFMATTNRLNGNGEIVRLAGRYQNAGRMIQAADFVTTHLWKPATLLRPAYALRQALDETLRTAAAGAPTFWNHPIHYLMSVAFDPAMDRKLMSALDQPNGGFLMMDEFQRSMMQGDILSIDDVRRVSTDMWLPGIDQADSRFVSAWGRELGQLAADPVASRLARGDTVDDITRELMDGDLAYVRESMGQRTLSQSLGADEPGARQYVESVQKRLRHHTGDNPTLVQAVGDGFLQGADERLYFSHPGTFEPTKGFTDVLAGLVEHAPEKVKVEKTLDTAGRHAWMDTVNRWTGNMFAVLATRPINRLTRAPAFRYFYFDSLADRMAFFTREAQEAIIEQAGRYHVTRGWRFDIGDRTFGTGDDLLSRLENGLASGKTGDLGIKDAELFGRMEAMEQVEHLLGDFSRRGQSLDALRIVTPFGNAWREALGAYGRLLKRNPLVVRRPMQAVNAGMESGFFYEDQNGQLVFSYPGSAALLSRLGAPPFPMTGRVRGLTMGFEVTPGLGPMVTIPGAGFIPDTPSWDGAREVLVPFGTESDQRFLVPEWMEKFGTVLANVDGDGTVGNGVEGIANFAGNILGGNSKDSTQMWQGSIIDTASYLISTGEYDTSIPSEVDRLMDDARRQAANLWIWRGVAQSVAPSAPRPNPVFEVGDGETMLVWPMFERLQELREIDPLQANTRFLAEFGPLAFGLLSSKTESSALYTPYDQAGFDWMRTHSDLMDTYPEIATFFAPMGGGPAGIGAYLRRVEEGELETVTPREWFERGQDALASTLYATARDRARQVMDDAGYEPNAAMPEELQDWLRGERLRLLDEYPGYETRRLEAPEIDRTISQLREALASEDVFADSDAGVALSEYLDLRQQALDEIDRATTADSLGAQSAAPLRSWLRGEGERLVAEHPDFANVWDRVFSREVDLAEEN